MHDKTKKLSTSLEGYLEVILQLEEAQRVARVGDIATQLSVKTPSVTGALKNLRARGLVNYEKNGFITLTEEGKQIAQKVFSKHQLLLLFLRDILFVPPEKAAMQACAIEHSIDQNTADRVRNLTNFIKTSVREKLKWDDRKWEEMLSKPEQ